MDIHEPIDFETQVKRAKKAKALADEICQSAEETQQKRLKIEHEHKLKLQHFLSRIKISFNKKCKCNITPKDFFSTVKVFFSKIEPKVNLCQISNSKELFIQPESRGKIPHYLKLEKRRFYTRLHRRKLLPKPRDQFDVCK